MAAIAVAATAVDMMELVALVADIAAAMVASTFGVAVGSESVEDLTTALFVRRECGVGVAVGIRVGARVAVTG
jgi:hypothetical protein